MKLELTLPERPGLLHAVPIFDLFALLLLFFLMGPSFVQQPGVMVDPAPSRFQLERYEESLVVTLGPGEPQPRLHLGREAVNLAQLGERLDRLREDGAPARSIVLMKTDQGTPVAMEREVMELILEKGYRVALVGQAVKGAQDMPVENPPSGPDPAEP